MQTIEEVAQEGSSFYPRIDFLSESGGAVVPDTLYWNLTDMDGNTINARSAVQVVSPSQSYYVFVLSGADLNVLGNGIAERILTAYGTYTSSVHGSNRPFLFQVKFGIQPKVGKKE